MAQSNHSYIDILKIDIEGPGYGVLDARDAAGTMPIGREMIELHLVDDQHINFEGSMKWSERLKGFGMQPT
jgi:hypothetical protein